MIPRLESIFRPYVPSDAERSDRSAGDRARHRLKVRESIRENIADIIAEESIIGRTGAAIKYRSAASGNSVSSTANAPASRRTTGRQRGSRRRQRPGKAK
jgi:hypothetical protein